MAKLTKPRGRFPICLGDISGYVMDRGSHLECIVELHNKETGGTYHLRMTQAEFEKVVNDIHTNEVFVSYEGKAPTKPL